MNWDSFADIQHSVQMNFDGFIREWNNDSIYAEYESRGKKLAESINATKVEEGNEDKLKEYPGHTSGATYPYNRYCTEHSSGTVFAPSINTGGTP